MKKILLIVASVVLSFNLFAQIPERMSYQAVVRNNSNQLVTNQTVGIRVSILQGAVDGTSIYTETHTTTTNANGLMTIQVGSGTAHLGTFSSINWANGPYFMKTETDIAGGVNYTIVGTEQFLSVPFALYAKNAANGFTGEYNDLKNKPNLNEKANLIYVDSIFNILKTDTLGFYIDFNYVIEKVNTQNYGFVARVIKTDISSGVPVGAVITWETNLLNYGVPITEENATAKNGDFFLTLKYEINGKIYRRSKIIIIDVL